MLADPEQPTRLGNSVSRDTCPDFALTRSGRWSEWTNLETNLGSDYMIVHIEIARKEISRKTSHNKLRQVTSGPHR